MKRVTIAVRRVGDLIMRVSGSGVQREEQGGREKTGEEETRFLAKNCSFPLFRRDNAANVRRLPIPFSSLPASPAVIRPLLRLSCQELL